MSSGVFVGLIFSQKVLNQLQCEVFRVFPSWGLEKHSQVDICHFIIPHIHGWRGEKRCLWVFSLDILFKFPAKFSQKFYLSTFLLHCTKMLIGQILELLWIHIPRSHNNNIFPHEIVFMELLQKLLSNRSNVFSDSKHRLSQEMVSIALIYKSR